MQLLSPSRMLFSIGLIGVLMFQCKPKEAISTDPESFRTIPNEATEEIEEETETIGSTSSDYYDRGYTRSIDHIYRPSIHTVLLHPEGEPLQPPLLQKGGGKKLLLSFDDFSGQRKEFGYRIIHCNANWQPSELDQQDFLQGFANDLILNAASSETTNQPYVHYRYVFPNDQIQLTRSGNYLIHIMDGDSIVITKRFYFAERRIGVIPNLKRPTLINERNYRQELDFVLAHPTYQIMDPYRALKVILRQNNRWDNAIVSLQPNFVKNNELVYDHDEENVFEGGNEFRNLDLKNLQFQPGMIKSIQMERDRRFHVYLNDDEARSYKQYLTSSDLNGKFLIKKDDALNTALEADYVYVHFALPYSHPETKGDIYIFGQLSDWQFKEAFKMGYDYDQKKYVKTLLLKQGYYNYAYVYLGDHAKSGEFSVVEGTHFETENDYSIYVYYRQPDENYDRLIGVHNLNSLKRN